MIIKRAGSVKNFGKQPNRFRFSVTIESLDKVSCADQIVVVWERGSGQKLEYTNPTPVDQATRKAVFDKQSLSADVTLFRKSNQPNFEDKVMKLAIRAGSIDGKECEKIRLNFAEYATVPSSSQRVRATLSGGSILIAHIETQFLPPGAALSGAKPAETPAQTSSSQPNSPMFSNISSPADYLRQKLMAKVDSAMNLPTKGNSSNGNGFLSRVGSAINISRKGRGQQEGGLARVGSKRNIAQNGQSKAGGLSSEELAELEALRKENTSMRQTIEAHELCNTNAPEQYGALTTEIANLKKKLQGEPEYEKVIRELKDVKVALATLCLDKENLSVDVLRMREEKQQSRTGRKTWGLRA